MILRVYKRIRSIAVVGVSFGVLMTVTTNAAEASMYDRVASSKRPIRNLSQHERGQRKRRTQEQSSTAKWVSVVPPTEQTSGKGKAGLTKSPTFVVPPALLSSPTPTPLTVAPAPSVTTRTPIPVEIILPNTTKVPEGIAVGTNSTTATTSAPLSEPLSETMSPAEFTIPPTISNTTAAIPSPNPTPPRYTHVERIEQGRLVHWHACTDTILPAFSSPLAMIPILFSYHMTVTPDAWHELQIPALESALNERLAEVYLGDCTYPPATDFSVYSVASDPYDHVVGTSECGADCRLVHGGITLQTFYTQRRRRKLQHYQVEQHVAQTLQSLLSTIRVMEIVSLEWVGLAGNELTTVNTTTTPTTVQQAPSANAPLGLSWSVALVALAAATLVLAMIGAFRRKSGLDHTERYTFEVPEYEEEPDDVTSLQRYANDDLMLDAQWSSPTEQPSSPRRRAYQSPDTLDL